MRQSTLYDALFPNVSRRTRRQAHEWSRVFWWLLVSWWYLPLVFGVWIVWTIIRLLALGVTTVSRMIVEVKDARARL